MAKDKNVEGDRLLKAVEAIAINPEDAKDLVRKYERKIRKNHPNSSETAQQEMVADKIIERYAYLSAVSGGVTALAGVVPGVGTAVAMLGGTAADVVVTIKLQVDMSMCIAEAFGYDLNNEDARHLSFLIAAGGTLEQTGAKLATDIGSKAGVNMLRQYLRGAVLVAVREFFRRLGIVFTRKALEKALPFGIGVGVGSSANYILTKYVGRVAKNWFVIDRDGE